VQVNVLVTDEHRACLADFGLSTASDSKVFNATSLSTKHAGGTLRWTAPEIFQGDQPINTSSSDIYSFACVSYEVYFAYRLVRCDLLIPSTSQIFSGLIPFHEIHDHAVILPVIRGQRPSRPCVCDPWNIACEDLGLDDETWGVIDTCWDMEPERRPVAKEVGAFLCAKLGRCRDDDESVARDSPWVLLELVQ